MEGSVGSEGCSGLLTKKEDQQPTRLWKTVFATWALSIYLSAGESPIFDTAHTGIGWGLIFEPGDRFLSANPM